MSTPRLVSLIGLGFGDCGKGVFTDALCRRWQAHTVVRFNGGAQAGHNVVLPDGRHHTFSQFSAGSLVPGVATVLAHPVVVHPGGLLVEHARLQSIGVHDGLERLLIDARCRINTPFHQAAGRLRELARGAAAHGTCGVGVGETVRHGLNHPDHLLRYADLARPALAMQKLERIRQDFVVEFANIDLGSQSEFAAAEHQLLSDPHAAELWLSSIAGLLHVVRPAGSEQINEHLLRPGTVLFEGAQGVLLDEWNGFHPHTTWSSIHTAAVDAIAAEYGFLGRVEHLGILRSYLTRHGQGPFPTADSALDILPEPHNSDQGWQGQFRRGHPDGVLLRYALDVAGKLDGLLVSHLDIFQHVESLRWCDAYETEMTGTTQLCLHAQTHPKLIRRLYPASQEDLEHQSALTRVLFNARPVYASTKIKAVQSLIEHIEHTSRCSIWFGSYGPTHKTIDTFREKV